MFKVWLDDEPPQFSESPTQSSSMEFNNQMNSIMKNSGGQSQNMMNLSNPYNQMDSQNSYDYQNDRKAVPQKKFQSTRLEEVEEVEDENYQSRNNFSGYKKSFDEVQIGGKGSQRFEDLLQEELNANPDALSIVSLKKDSNSNRQFLKKGTRTNLSSAAQREPRILTESSQRDEMESFYENKANTAKKPHPKIPKCLQQESKDKGSEKTNEPKKFLTRGGGIGGGIGNKESHEEEVWCKEAPSFENEFKFEKNKKKSPRESLRGQEKRVDVKKKENSTYNSEDKENVAHVANFEGEIPVSNLVNKYFYQKKPTKGKEKEVEVEEPKKNEKEDNLQKLIHEKIEELNAEAGKFKLKNEGLKKLKEKCDDILKVLKKDMADWDKQKEKEKREFEEWKQEELNKVKHEKKLAGKYQKNVSNNPSRKEREEIDNLKKQLTKITEEIHSKEKRSKFTMERQKRQIEEAEQQNSELNEELRILGEFNPELEIQKKTENKDKDKLPNKKGVHLRQF